MKNWNPEDKDLLSLLLNAEESGKMYVCWTEFVVAIVFPSSSSFKIF
jgi:hypothetical protein